MRLAKKAIFIVHSKFLNSFLVNTGIAVDRISVNYCGVPIPEKFKISQSVALVNILHPGRLVDTKSPDRTILALEITKRRA